MCWACEESTIKMPRILTENTSPFIKVVDDSPKFHRKAVEQIAFFFLKETKNGFLQYNANNPSEKSGNSFIPTISFLFTENETLHYTPKGKQQIGTKGACCFRKREYQNLPQPIWEVDWIWLHPFERGKGFLDQNWKYLISDFDLVFPSHPVSKSMLRFLEKHNYPISPLDYFNL